MPRRKNSSKQNPTGIPQGAVAADGSQQVPNNSYDDPPTYYVDIEFKCCDCKSVETWTAKQQDLKTARAWAIKESFRWFWEYTYAGSFSIVGMAGLGAVVWSPSKKLQRC